LRGNSLSAHRKGSVLILNLTAENEGSDGDTGDSTGLLSSLIPLRADIAAGDHRALYLAWLSSVQSGELTDDEAEPPVPPGLGALSAPLKALADFLYIGTDLITAAAARSEPINDKTARRQLERWIAGLSESDKTALLCRLANGEEHALRAELLRRFHNVRLAETRSTTVRKTRTVAELMDEVERRRRPPTRTEARRTRQVS
jgi:hypothetical protein